MRTRIARLWRRALRPQGEAEDAVGLLRRLGPPPAPLILHTGVELDDPLLLALAALPGARINAVPVNDAARTWLGGLDHPAITVREPSRRWPQERFDILACASPLEDAGRSLHEADWLARALLAPRGRLLLHAALPESLRPDASFPPPDAVRHAQEAVLSARRGALSIRPGTLPGLALRGWTPRRRGAQSHVGWAGFVWIADGAGSALRPPLFAAAGLEPVLDSLIRPEDAPSPPERRFDRVMFVDNAFTGDPRALRAAEAADSPRGRLLAVGMAADAETTHARLPWGAPLIRLPNLRTRIGRRLRLAGISRERGAWWELRMAALAPLLARLLPSSDPSRGVLHTHDMMGLYAGGAAMDLCAEPGPFWIHDVHEYVRGYDGVIDVDPTVRDAAKRWEDAWISRPDRLVTVSEALAERLQADHGLKQAPAVVWNAPDAESADTGAVPDMRARHAIPAGAPLLVHAGSIRPGRGVDVAIRALSRLPGFHLLCIGAAGGAYESGLEALAAKTGVSDRLHLHPAVPAAALPGLIAQADMGLIPMERYGNAEVALPNKLFLYLHAGLPVVASATGAVDRFLKDWPAGGLCAPGAPPALAQAITQAWNDRETLRAAAADPVRRREASWAGQKPRLEAIYKDLQDP